MGTDPRSVTQHLRDRLSARDPDAVADGDLLAAFAATRGETEFAALLARHGPMVLSVCRRLLGNAADADDAFQAVFLVLAQRAAALSAARSVAGWLYGTAVRVALKARTRDARRRTREHKAALMRPTDSPDPSGAAHSDDLRAVLDEELERLDARYRDPVVLCCIEGRSHGDAARLLGCPEGTVSGRLSRAKELLRARLARRGVACSVATITALLSSRGASAVPADLTCATLATVTGTAPAAVAQLAAAAPRWGWYLGAASVVGLLLAGGAVALTMWSAPPVPPPNPETVSEPATVKLAHGSEVLTVAVSPDGAMATAGPGAEVRLWKPDGTPAARCALPGGGAAVAFAPDGKALSAAGYEGSVRVWDAQTGELRHTLTGHGESAQAAAFSPDGALLATAGEDGRVRLWDATTGKSLRDLDAHTGRVWGLSFSPDGRELASAGGDKSVRIWNPATGAELRRFGDLRGVYAVEYHPSGQFLAVAADNTVLLLDARTGRELGRVGTGRTAVTWFAFSPDGRTLAYRDEKSVKLWEVASGADRLAIELAAEPSAVAFAPRGSALVVAWGTSAEVFELRKQVRPLPGSDPNALWNHLTGADAGLAFRAVEALVAAPDKAVPLLREKLHAVADFRGHVQALVRQLGDDDFETRERATRQLEAIGPDAVPALRHAFANDTSPEVRLRADRLLKRIPAAGAPRATPTEVRAVEVLERVGTPAAREALAALAARDQNSPLKREAAAALLRLRGPKP